MYAHQQSDCGQLNRKQDENVKKLSEVYFNPNCTLLTVWTTNKHKAQHEQYYHRYFRPNELFWHLRTTLESDTDVRIECCDANVKLTLDEFGHHICCKHEIDAI
ncbi:hypothetical protein I4U23_013029 [Adineta vaga]|nr:hypothetical protein I4U23_013029 [Adineta vaga]